MTVAAGRVESTVLPTAMEYLAYLPPGAAEESGPFPVLYLLHGRGDGATSWRDAFMLFDRVLADGTVPPFVAIAPDAPWSRRGGFWVDSQYEGDGANEPGAAVASAVVRELVPHIDATLPTLDRRESRALCGYSMGGAGALSLALAHQGLFSAAIALSPAVYDPLPPNDSTARTRGAFGRGRALFDEQRYLELGYATALAAVRPELPLQLFVGGGWDEEPSADPDALPPHLEVARFVEGAGAAPGVTAEVHMVRGGHDWTTWLPLLERALPAVIPRLVR